MSRLLTIASAVLALSLAGADVAAGQTASRVIRLIDQRCANCHRDPGADRAPDVAGAPEPATLRQMPPETILEAIMARPSPTVGARTARSSRVPPSLATSSTAWTFGSCSGFR